MLSSLLVWGALIYIVIVVIWRFVASVAMIIAMYAEDGIAGAISAAAFSFLINVWALAKFAFSLLAVAFLIKACS